MAVDFDPSTAMVRGTAVPVMPAGSVQTLLNGGLGLRLSPAGTLGYLPRGFTARHIMSVGRDGSARALPLPPGGYTNPRISPEGRHLSVENDGHSIEALDLARGTSSTLTTMAFGTFFSTWKLRRHACDLAAFQHADLDRRRRQRSKRPGPRRHDQRLPIIGRTRRRLVHRPSDCARHAF